MHLYLSATSPYARLVRATLIEKGLDAEVEKHFVDPWASRDELTRINPLSRVPTLVTDGGTVLTESLVIVQYLERAFPQPALIPKDDAEQVLHRLALGHGLIDQAVGIISSRKFRKDSEVDGLIERRFSVLRSALPAVAEELSGLAPAPDLGDLAIAVALGYLEFRLPALEWRSEHSNLAHWYAVMTARPSMRETAPPADA